MLGMIPAVVLGLVFHDTIKSLFNPVNVMYALVVGGFLLLIAAECLKPKSRAGLDDMTYRRRFMIGCFQCLALWPGFSRSGATISGGMLMGVTYARIGILIPAGRSDDDGRDGVGSQQELVVPDGGRYPHVRRGICDCVHGADRHQNLPAID